MEKKKRLGRGLDEVADLWLSCPSVSSEDLQKPEEKPEGEYTTAEAEKLSIKNKKNGDFKKPLPLHALKTFSLIYPESTKVKGLLAANLILLLAKMGYGTCVLDYGSNITHLKSIMGTLFQTFSSDEIQGNVSDSRHQVIKLYGIPGIHLFSSFESEIPEGLRNPNLLFNYLKNNNLQDSLIFFYYPDTLEYISMLDDIPQTIILISRPRRESLLISYAYLKAIMDKKGQARVWLMMDDVSDEDEAVRAYTFLKQITSRRLSGMHSPIEFLGAIIHDQAFGISLATHFPLALSEERSEAKDSMIEIAGTFVKLLEGLE